MREVQTLENKKSSILISRTTVATMGSLYLTVPIIIFFLGYMKLFIGIPLSLLMAYCTWFFIRDFNKDANRNPITNDGVEIKISSFIGLIIFALIWSVMSGIGEFTWCSLDHIMRAPILKDLVDYKWPVIYDFKTQENPIVRDYLGDGSAAFAYYFAYWMIPAVVGKVLGLMAARITLVIWSALGLFIVLLGMTVYEKKYIWIIPLSLILFGGMDFVPYLIKVKMGYDPTWEGWNNQMYIHGNYFQITNVYNQTIPGFVIALLMMLSRNNRSIGFLGGLMFCYSPWATIGMLPLALCQLFRKEMRGETFKINVKNILTITNIIIPIVVLAVFVPFYMANPAATDNKGFMWEYVKGPVKLITSYILYVIFEFGMWCVVIYKKQKHEILYWGLIITLMIFPIYNISRVNDLMMRGSLIPMFVLTVFVTHELIAVWEDIRKNRTEISKISVATWFTLAVFFFSAQVPMNFIVASIESTIREPNMKEMSEKVGSFGNINDESELWLVDLQFLVEGYEDNFFFKYLAK